MPLKRDPKQGYVGNRTNTRLVGYNSGKLRWSWDARALNSRGVWAGGVGPSFPDVTTGVLYANDNTPVITETYVTEIMLPFPCRINGLVIQNGSASAGNITVALADSDGNPLAGIVSASTAQGTANTLQKIPFALPYDAEGPARYFAMIQFSSASARYRGHKIGHHYCAAITGQTYGTIKAFTPPTAWAAAGSFHAGFYTN